MHRPIEINSQEITEVVFLQQIYTNGVFTCKMLVDGGIRYRNKLTVSAVSTGLPHLPDCHFLALARE